MEDWATTLFKLWRAGRWGCWVSVTWSKFAFPMINTGPVATWGRKNLFDLHAVVSIIKGS